MRLKITKTTLPKLVREPGRKIIEMLDNKYHINCFRQDSKIPNFEPFYSNIQTQIQNNSNNNLTNYSKQIHYLKLVDTLMDMIVIHLGTHTFRRTMFSRSYGSQNCVNNLANMLFVDNNIAIEEPHIKDISAQKINSIIKDISNIYNKFYDKELIESIFIDSSIFKKIYLYKLLDSTTIRITNDRNLYHQPFFAIEFLVEFRICSKITCENKTYKSLRCKGLYDQNMSNYFCVNPKNAGLTLCFIPLLNKILAIACDVINDERKLIEDKINVYIRDIINDDYYSAILEILEVIITDNTTVFGKLVANGIDIVGINNIYTGNTIHNLLVECHYKNNDKYVLLFDHLRNSFKEIKKINDIEMIKNAFVITDEKLVTDTANITQKKQELSHIKEYIVEQICEIGESSITIDNIMEIFKPRITDIISKINELYEQSIDPDRFTVAIKYTKSTVVLKFLYDLHDDAFFDIIELCVYNYCKKKNPYKIKDLYSDREHNCYFSELVDAIISGEDNNGFNFETLELFSMISKELINISAHESSQLIKLCAQYFSNVNNNEKLNNYEKQVHLLTKYINTFKTGEVYDDYMNNLCNNVTINDTNSIVDFLIEMDYYMHFNNRFTVIPIIKEV